MSIVGLLAPGFLGELFDAIPSTDLDECRAALAEGRYIDASFDCPAGTLLRELAGMVGTGPDDEEEDTEDEEAP